MLRLDHERDLSLDRFFSGHWSNFSAERWHYSCMGKVISAWRSNFFIIEKNNGQFQYFTLNNPKVWFWGIFTIFLEIPFFFSRFQIVQILIRGLLPSHLGLNNLKKIILILFSGLPGWKDFLNGWDLVIFVTNLFFGLVCFFKMI